MPNTVPGRPFAKGVSPNPGGRPKGVTAAVKALVGDNGEKLIEGLYAMAFGTPAQLKKKFGVAPNAKDRIAAMSVLLDRGFGKALQEIATPLDRPVVVTFGGRYKPNQQEPE